MIGIFVLHQRGLFRSIHVHHIYIEDPSRFERKAIVSPSVNRRGSIIDFIVR